MSKKKSCPDCGAELENDICPECGWGGEEESGKKETGEDEWEEDSEEEE